MMTMRPSGKKFVPRAPRGRAPSSAVTWREHPWEISKDGAITVTIIVLDKEVLVELQCRWKELLTTQVFDAIKSLQLDVLSVKASPAPDGSSLVATNNAMHCIYVI
jgi:hypothetical protein